MKYIKKMTTHRGALERRLQYVESQIDQARGAPNPYDLNEAKSLRVALQCMRFVQVVQTADIVKVVNDLVESISHGDDDDIVTAVGSAKMCLRLIDSAEREGAE